MPKYKYVDGVKYRVVPQSVLGYALVREGSDNSLPSGGTEGQVLAKASNADYDVEWSTVEGGSGAFYVDVVIEEVSVDVETDINDILEAITTGKYIVAKLPFPGGREFELVPLTHYILDVDGLTNLSFEKTFYVVQETVNGDMKVVGINRIDYDSIDGWSIYNNSYTLTGLG